MAAPLSSHGRSVLGLSRSGQRSPSGRPPTGRVGTPASRAQTARSSVAHRPSSRAHEEDLLRRLHEKRIRIQRELAETDAALNDAASALSGPASRGSSRHTVRTATRRGGDADAVRLRRDAVPRRAARVAPLTPAIRCRRPRRASTKPTTSAPPWCRPWTASCRGHPPHAVRCDERVLRAAGCACDTCPRLARILARTEGDGGIVGDGSQNV